MKELVAMVKAFSKVMDKYTNWKNPTPEHALLFAIGEMGEAIQAWVYEDAAGGYSPNNVNETVGQEVVDCFIMCVKAGYAGGVKNVYPLEEDEEQEGLVFFLLESLQSLNTMSMRRYLSENRGDVTLLIYAVSLLNTPIPKLITKHSVTYRLLSIAQKQIGKLVISAGKKGEIWRKVYDTLELEPKGYLMEQEYFLYPYHIVRLSDGKVSAQGYDDIEACSKALDNGLVTWVDEN